MIMRTMEHSIRIKLAARRGEWPSIAKKAGVSHSWISKFVNDHIPNPGLRTLERISGSLDELADESGEFSQGASGAEHFPQQEAA